MKFYRTGFQMLACASMLISSMSHILASDAEQIPFDIPYVDGIMIDGKADDWGDRGFRVDWMNVKDNGARVKPEDFDPRMRIGWNEKGLLLIFNISDDKITEPKDNNLANGDSIEIFVTDNPQGERFQQFSLAPDLKNNKTEPSIKKPNGKEIECARNKTEKGYACELLLPWKNLGKTFAEGNTVYLQAYVNDKDENNKYQRYLFYPLELDDAYYFRNNLYPLRLSRAATPPIVSRNEVRWDGKANTLEITGIPELAGKEFTVRSANRELAKGQMGKKAEGGSFGKIVIPSPLPDEYLSDFEIKFSDGLKCKGATSAFKPINLLTEIKTAESPEGNLKLNVDLATYEKTPGYYFISPLTAKCIFIDENGKELAGAKGKTGEDISLKVPKTGSYALLVTLCDSEDDVVAGRVLHLTNGKVVQPTASDKPSVIAVSGIGPFNWMLAYFKDLHMNDITSLRDRISSILVHNYNCITLSRARGYSMAVENSINKMTLLTSENTKPTPASLQVAAADFAITGHYKFTGKQNPIFIDRDYTCEIMLNEIRSAGDKFKKFNITSDPASYWRIVAPIIAEMDLQPRLYFGKKEDKLNETWAVLPIAIAGIPMNSETISSTMSIEMALQESGRIARLVSHNEIEKILQEMKIKSLNGATENLAGDIAKIVGADRVVMGTASGFGNKKYQLDLFIVDGNNAAILDSASAICSNGDISDSASLLALKLAERRYESPSLPAQSDSARKKEAGIYKKIAAGTRIFNGDTGSKDLRVRFQNYLYSHAMSNLEAAYYLVGNDELESYLVIEAMLFNTFQYWAGIIEPSGKKNTIRIVDNILKPITPTKNTKGALSYRAVVRDFAGLEYEEAERILKEQKIKYPNLDDVYCDYRLICLYYKMEKLIEAAGLIEKLPGDYVYRWQTFYADVYHKLGNEQKELEVLENIDIKDYAIYDSSYPFRYITLTAKLNGPENAIKAYKELSTWSSTRPDIQLELAKCYLAIGDKRKSGSILTLINNDKAIEYCPNAYDGKKLREEIKTLIAQTGEVKCEWKTGAQVRKFSDKYKIYIQPVGKQEIKLLEEVALRLAEFYGTRVEVLPEIPLPESNPYVFSKERGQYFFDSLLRAIAVAAPVPNDACFVSNVIKESMYTGNLRFIYSCNNKFDGSLISYNSWQRLERKDIVDCIAKSVAGSFYSHYGTCLNLPEDISLRKWFAQCKNSNCIFTSSGDMSGPLENNFSMCEDCQQQYSKVDLDKVYFVFQNMGKGRGWNKFSKVEKEQVDKYKNEIADALAKRAKETELKK